MIDLNFVCEQGDLIFVRSLTIVYGRQDFSVSSWNNYEWNRLGDEHTFSWDIFDNDHYTLCLVIAKHVFPDEAWNLNHLELLLSDGRTGRIFDDPQNGFWIPFDQAEQCPKVKEMAVNAWVKWPPARIFSRRSIHARVDEMNHE